MLVLEQLNFKTLNNKTVFIMKNSNILFIIFAFLTMSLTAQKTVWFDSNWNVSVKEKAAYYRPAVKKTDKGYLIEDYYISGKKQMEGFSKTNKPNNEMYVGLVKYFYENGQIFQKVYYNEGKPEGKFSEFYDTGELKRTGKYQNGLREGSWKVYYKSGKIQQKGKYKEGEKRGIWKTFYKNI
jgi:antitoxin component YwqK of YwqJK toxin-antitoxin module